jgi:hypothetical protein
VTATTADAAPEDHDADQEAGTPPMPHRLVAVGWAVVVLGSVWRMWAVAGAWFWQDDVIHVWQAATTPFGEFLGLAWNGHLEPASWAFYWVATALAPQSWGPPFLFLTAVQVWTFAAFWILLRRLLEPSWLLLVPLAVFVLGTTSLTAYLWLATALEISVPLLLLVLALNSLVRYAADRKGRRMVAISAYFSVALLFQERGLIIVPFLVLVVLTALVEGGVRRRVVATWRLAPVLWVVLVVVGTGYVLLAYLPYSGVADQVSERAQIPDMASAAWIAVSETLVPTLVGGNWAPPVDGTTIAPRPATAWLMVSWALVGGAFAVGLLRRPRAARWSLVLVGGVLALEVVALVVTRLDFIGTLAARDPRYVTFSSVAVALALGLALLPTRARRAEDQEPAVQVPERLGARTVGLAAVALLAVSSYPSLQYTADAVHDRQARGWITNAREQASRQPGVTYADARVPTGVIGDIFVDYQWASVALGVGPDQPVFNKTAVDVEVFDGFGNPRPAALIDVLTQAPAGPSGPCGYSVTTSPVTIYFPRTAGDDRSAIRLAYISRTPTTLRVRSGASSETVEVPAGLRSLWVFPGTPTGSVTLQGVEAGAALCVTEAKLGTPWPSGG